MPGETESNGAVLGCECNDCVAARQSAPPTTDWGLTDVEEESTLTECALCSGLTDTWTQCACRPCPHCGTPYNTVMMMMCDPCFAVRVVCPVCGRANLTEDTSRCRCGVENLCRTCLRDRHTPCCSRRCSCRPSWRD